ncbi:hypothetical protein OIE68_19910 [Nocardia vinacea]|uniref:hypothetical protein n=1 Tax=Nocardia vinacea TaxID=96468 RepID=UPI002E13A4C3|nr:hypothetical protein OIE68_19910 [Nocardia vinacea]
MAQSLDVDVERLRALVPEYEDIGADAQRLLDQLKAALAREGEPWGKDTPGQAFAETYVPDRDKGIASLAKTVASLREEGKVVSDLLESFDREDREAARSISDAGDQSQPTSQNVAPTAPTDPYSQGQQTPITTDTTPDTTQSSPRSQPDPGYQPAPTSTPTPGTSGTQSGPASTAPTPSSPNGNGMPGMGSPFGESAGSPNARDTSGSRPESTPTTGNSAPPTTARPTVDAPAADPKQPNTPWSRGAVGTGFTPDAPAPKAAAAGPAQTSAPGNATPRVSAPSSVPPRMSAPYLPDQHQQQQARPAPKAAGKAFGAEGKSAARHPWAADGLAGGENALLARKLAERHDLELVGFDDPSVDGYTIREIAAALDDVLTQYPYVDLRQIAIAESADAATRLEWDWVAGATGPEPFTRRIVLDTVVARNPGVFAEYIRSATHSGKLARGSDRRPVYSTMVRELGHALDVAGSFRARQAAQDALIAEFTRTRGTAPRDKADTASNSEYEQWRAQLSGYGFHDGRFDPGMAVADAFTEVQINGSEAAAPAKVLHRLLVDTARKTATP